MSTNEHHKTSKKLALSKTTLKRLTIKSNVRTGGVKDAAKNSYQVWGGNVPGVGPYTC